MIDKTPVEVTEVISQPTAERIGRQRAKIELLSNKLHETHEELIERRLEVYVLQTVNANMRTELGNARVACLLGIIVGVFSAVYAYCL